MTDKIPILKTCCGANSSRFAVADEMTSVAFVEKMGKFVGVVVVEEVLISVLISVRSINRIKDMFIYAGLMISKFS